MSERQSEDNYPGNSESPLVVLKRQKDGWYFYIFILVALIPYSIFGVILPVLKSGNYAAIWPHVRGSSIGRHILHYYASWGLLLSLPYWWVTVFRCGNIYFYNDRLIVKPFWGRGKIVIPYQQMHVRLNENSGNICIIITMQRDPGWAHPLQRYKVRYWNGLSIGNKSNSKIAGIETSPWENPAYAQTDILKAIQILRGKAFSFTG